MSDHPRDQKVFNMPIVATDPLEARGTTPDPSKPNEPRILWLPEPKVTIPTDQYINKKENPGTHLETIDGLGITGKAVTVMPIVEKTYTNTIKDAPYVDYKVNLAEGSNTITVKCLPTFRLYQGFKLQYAISVNDDEPQVVNVDTKEDSKDWSANVLRGYSIGKTVHQVSKTGAATVRIYMLDPSLVLSQLEVF